MALCAGTAAATMIAFKKILIANRGEIACRVARTAKALGYRTVAVFSDADARAVHVRQADEAVRVGPPPARESYLNIEALLAAAKLAGADAVHPGYGFLSENAAFAEACTKAGLVFIGPPAAAIDAMGNKARAKALMEAAGVPVVPGYRGADQSDETLIREARRIGFPLGSDAMRRPSPDARMRALAAVLMFEARANAANAPSAAERWFSTGAAAWPLRLTLDDATHVANIATAGHDRYAVTLGDGTIDIAIVDRQHGNIRFAAMGLQQTARFAFSDDVLHLDLNGTTVAAKG